MHIVGIKQKLANLELAKAYADLQARAKYFASGEWATVKDGVVDKVERFLGRRVVVLSGKFGGRRGFVGRYVLKARGRKQ